jgi:adenine phosphoribosyltransferase
MQPSPVLQTLSDAVRNVPDFPKPGIIFKDITPVLADPALLSAAIDGMIAASGVSRVDKVIGIDARGFIFGALIAAKLNAGFVPIRKKGKLPWKTIGTSYDLEYGSATVEIHQDAVRPGETVILADDLLATGGTAAAALDLIHQLGGNVLGSVFFIELAFLNGREKLAGKGPVHALLNY